MSELHRILSDRKRLALLLLLPFLSLGLYLLERMGGEVRDGVPYLQAEVAAYRENVSRFTAMSPAEAEADSSESYWFDGQGISTLRSTKLHVASYADYLVSVQAQAERMSASAVFGRDKNSFTYRNIQKTARDFRALEDIKVEFGGNRALETWINFRGGDLLSLLAILVLVLAFFEDKGCGLLPLVRACPKGRRALAMKRLGILLLASCIGTLLLCGSTLVLAFSLYGGTDTLRHSIQSVESFRTCTLHLTIGEWIALCLGAKVFCGFLVGLVFWFILSFLSQMQLAWLVFLAILGAEYAAWSLIPPQMALAVLRYVNLFAYVFPAETLSAYGNMNLFGWPVGTMTLLAWLFLLLTLSLSAWVVFGSVRRQPFGNRNLLGRPMALWNRGCDVLRSRFPLVVMEGYKLLILGGTALFLLAALWYAPQLHSFGYSYGNAEDAIYNSYVREAAGPINADTDTYLTQAREHLIAYDGDKSKYEAALSRLEEDIENLQAKAAAGGYAPWLTDQARINNVLGSEVRNVRQWSGIVALVLILLTCGPVFAFEVRAGTVTLLRTTPNGRGPLFRRKYAVLFVEVLAIWAILYLRQWSATLDHVGVVSLDAPIQNVAILSHLPIHCTLRQILALIFVLRLVGMLVVGLLTAWISSRSKTWEQTVLTGSALLLLPALLAYFDRPWANYFSVLPLLTGTDLILSLPTNTEHVIQVRSAATLVASGLWLALSVLFTLQAFHRWFKCKT